MRLATALADATISGAPAGVPATMADPDLREFFAACGAIVSCTSDRGAYSAAHRVPKSAIIRFEYPASADTAIARMSGMKLRGEALVVEKIVE